MKAPPMSETTTPERHTPDQTTKHHDGFGLAESITIRMSAKDDAAGNGRHLFIAEIDGVEVASAQFQHGPRKMPGSTPGIIDSVLLAILIERYDAFQSGPYHCPENDSILSHLNHAMELTKARARERNSRDVLGTYER